jgi:adenosine deaminase
MTPAALAVAMPKVELHVHIEGTLEPPLMMELAARHGVTLPWPDEAAVRRAYDFGDLQSFLDVYYQGAAVLRTADDFFALGRAYYDRAAADRVRHAEVFFDPQTHVDRGVRLDVVVEGLRSAVDDARARHGITGGLIPCFLRHLSPEAAMATYEDCRRFGDGFLAFGLDSSERDRPPILFAEVFARLRAEGFRAVAHAGEEGPAAYVVQALDVLGVDRIDHGVRCLEDDDLVARLADEGTTLTVCPLSNVKLGVFPEIASHTLHTLLRRGVRATVNSDDPAYFGGYMTDNFAAVTHALRLGRDELYTLAGNAIAGAFTNAARKAELLRELDRCFAAPEGSANPTRAP